MSEQSFSFPERILFSEGARQRCDVETIRSMIDGCVSVEPQKDIKSQKAGVDYVALLDGGASINIDAKARDIGTSKFWKPSKHGDGTKEPELALETWSAMPVDGRIGQIGWTLSRSKQTDLVLFTFHPSDTLSAFLLSFQILRIAFERNLESWRKRFKSGKQRSTRDDYWWHSQCIFVPVSVVRDAMRQSEEIKFAF